MKIVKNAAKTLSLLYLVWWAGWLVFSEIGRTQENVGPPGMGLFFSVYVVFIRLSLVGMICSAMLSVSVFAFFSGNKKLRVLKAVTLAFCVMDNLLYQLFICSLFTGEVLTDEAATVTGLPWVICTIICGVLLIVQLTTYLIQKAIPRKMTAT